MGYHELKVNVVSLNRMAERDHRWSRGWAWKGCCRLAVLAPWAEQSVVRIFLVRLSPVKTLLVGNYRGCGGG